VREIQRVHRGMRAPFWSLDRRNSRAIVCTERGRLRQARALCCRTLAGRGKSASEVEAVGDAATVAMAALARVEYLEEDHGAAITWARRSLDHHRRRHGPAASYDLAASTLVRVALREGDLEGARRWTEELGRGPEPRWYRGPLAAAASATDADVWRAEVELACGDVAAATGAVRSAVVRARSEELLAAGLNALVTVARVLELRGEGDRSRRLAASLIGHPRASFETRREAARLPGFDDAADAAARDESPGGVLAALEQALADLR
jgi:ATP/maltotriose-dependent transcriptional regulator MalT